jgi:hypothetical protein
MKSCSTCRISSSNGEILYLGQCPWGSLRDLDLVRWTLTPLRNIANQRHILFLDTLPFVPRELDLVLQMYVLACHSMVNRVNGGDTFACSSSNANNFFA